LVRWVSTVAGETVSGRAAYSFFLKAVLVENALDAAVAEGHAALADFLDDDLGGGIGIEEKVANDLSDDFVGSAIVGFGPPLLVLEAVGAALLKTAQELKVALSGVVVLSGGPRGSQAFTLALQEHGQFQGDFIIGSHRQGAGAAFENEVVEFATQQHDGSPP